MKGTNIEWSDDTCNFSSGCDGCELWIPGKGGPCYAGNLHERRLAKTLPLLYDASFTNVRLIPGRMAKAVACMDLTGTPRLAGKNRDAKPWLDGLRRKIFVGDMGDMFSKAVPFAYLKEELIEIARSKNGSRHDLLCLTKQPGRALQFAEWLGEEWPANIWLGTSVTGKASLTRLDRLVAHPACVKFISLEPQVEDVDVRPWLDRIAWVIVGGESDQSPHRARAFHLDWARATLAHCRASETKFFLKQLGSNPVSKIKRLSLEDSHGGDWEEWPEDLRVREVPAA